MGEYVISESGALVWEADAAPTDIEIEHPLGETPQGHEHEDAEPKGGDELPSRSALLALSKEDLEAFALEHDVDPEGATKQQIVATLYGDE
jgi:hypothetical protein